MSLELVFLSSPLTINITISDNNETTTLLVSSFAMVAWVDISFLLFTGVASMVRSTMLLSLFFFVASGVGVGVGGGGGGGRGRM